VSGIVAARALLPADFGVVAIARTFSMLVFLLGNLGVGAFLIHQRDEVEDFCVAAFWMNLVVGVVLFTLQVAIAPLVAVYYGDALITRIMLVIALGYLVAPLGSIHGVLLQRDMRFRAITLRDLGLSTLASVLTIASIIAGLGLWSLVIPDLIVGVVGVLCNWRLHPWRPRLRLQWERWGRIFRYGRYLLGDGFLAFLINNADYMILGKVLGPAGLGLYSFAYQRSMIVPDYVAAPVASAAFPGLARVQRAPEELAQLYFKLAKATGFLVVPGVVLQAILAYEFVIALYGSKWAEAVLAMQLLLPYTLFRGLCVHLGTLLNAVGRPDVSFKYAIGVLPFLVSAVYLGAQYGINGAALATGLAFGATGPILTAIVFRTMGWPYRRFLESTSSPLIVAIGMGAGVWGVRAVLPEVAWRSSQLDLTLFGVLGILLFTGLLYCWDRDAYAELMGILRRATVRSA
jgi:O-antigen/teichoic acid export membrane protein